MQWGARGKREDWCAVGVMRRLLLLIRSITLQTESTWDQSGDTCGEEGFA